MGQNLLSIFLPFVMALDSLAPIYAQPQPTAHTMKGMNNQLISFEKSLEDIKMLMHKQFSFIALLQDFLF
jgi:hypothetical protein